MVKYFLEHTDWIIYALTRSSSDRVPNSDRVYINKHIHQMNKVKFDYIVHTAARTQVDESLDDVMPFILDNVMFTGILFEWIKKHQEQAKVCLFSSDEVLGPAKRTESFNESAPFKPSNPYSATKASQEMLAYSFAHSFGLNIFIVRCMNVIGQGENENKFIGKTIKAIRNEQKIILHGTGKDDVASRHWVYAEDVAADVHYLLLKDIKPKEIFHIAGIEVDVYTLASKIYEIIKKEKLPDNMIKWIDFHHARPGHDRRYSLDDSKLRNMNQLQAYKDIDTILREMIQDE